MGVCVSSPYAVCWALVGGVLARLTPDLPQPHCPGPFSH